MEKVILVSIDGMRPDGLKACKNEYLDELVKTASYTFDAKTVYPSITLPCHLSMFHSVPPERHGTDLPEDMTIPMFFHGNEFKPGMQLNDISILDIAPTIADIMNIPCAREWEGKSVVNIKKN